MTVVLLRHASAGDRDRWEGDDRLRPLDKKGRRQAKALREILLARGVTRALSSPYVRCVQTLEPLGLGVEPDDRLAEGADVHATLDLLRHTDGAVACTHGDVIEHVLGGLALKKAAGVVLDGLEIVERIDAP
jgi:phosphohistidine phosphatase SixA